MEQKCAVLAGSCKGNGTVTGGRGGKCVSPFTHRKEEERSEATTGAYYYEVGRRRPLPWALSFHTWGRVESWNSLAVTGSRDRLNWSYLGRGKGRVGGRH